MQTLMPRVRVSRRRTQRNWQRVGWKQLVLLTAGTALTTSEGNMHPPPSLKITYLLMTILTVFVPYFQVLPFCGRAICAVQDVAAAGDAAAHGQGSGGEGKRGGGS